jgi:hypothetical protein
MERQADALRIRGTAAAGFWFEFEPQAAAGMSSYRWSCSRFSLCSTSSTGPENMQVLRSQGR